MSDTSAGAVIVRHIEELEAAMRYARGQMTRALEIAFSDLLREKTQTLGWSGEIPPDLDEIWFAPNEWRSIDGTQDRYDLFVEFADALCLDGEETETWIGSFCGFAGSGVRFRLRTNVLGNRLWKAMLRSEHALVDKLIDAGFHCDAKTGEVEVLMTFEREVLAEAFAEDEFQDALMPVSWAIERIAKARPLLDQLVSLIRKRA